MSYTTLSTGLIRIDVPPPHVHWILQLLGGNMGFLGRGDMDVARGGGGGGDSSVGY